MAVSKFGDPNDAPGDPNDIGEDTNLKLMAMDSGNNTDESSGGLVEHVGIDY